MLVTAGLGLVLDAGGGGGRHREIPSLEVKKRKILHPVHE
jgi:hypothetical protein